MKYVMPKYSTEHLKNEFKGADWCWLLTCPVEDFCRWYGPEFEANAREMKETLDAEHKNCQPENHCVEKVHAFDAFSIEAFYRIQPRSHESANQYMNRVWQAVRREIKNYMQTFGECTEEQLNELLRPEPVGVWLRVRFTNGNSRRYWYEWVYDPDEAIEACESDLDEYGSVTVYKENRTPVVIYAHAVAAVELWASDDEQ